jgi:hypothetical protein
MNDILYDFTRVTVDPDDPEGQNRAVCRQLSLVKSFTTYGQEVKAVVVKQPTIFLGDKRCGEQIALPELCVMKHPNYGMATFTQKLVCRGEVVTCYYGSPDPRLGCSGENVVKRDDTTGIELWAHHNSIFEGRKLEIPVVVNGAKNMDELIKHGLLGQLVACASVREDTNCKVSCFLFDQNGRITTKNPAAQIERFADTRAHRFRLQVAGPEPLSDNYLGIAVVFTAKKDIPPGRALVSSHKWWIDPVTQQSMAMVQADILANLAWVSSVNNEPKSMLVVPVPTVYEKISKEGKTLILPEVTELNKFAWGLTYAVKKKASSLEKWLGQADDFKHSSEKAPTEAVEGEAVEEEVLEEEEPQDRVDAALPQLYKLSFTAPDLECNDDTAQLLKLPDRYVKDPWTLVTESDDEWFDVDPDTGDVLYPKTPVTKRSRKQAEPRCR